MRTRSWLSGTLLVLALVATACGNDDEAATAETAASTTTTAASTSTTEAVPASTTTVAAATEYPLTVQHAGGETVIPSRPERVVTTFAEVIGEKVVALGVTPVASGALSTPLPAGVDGHGLEVFTGMASIGTYDRGALQLNIEAVVASDPDLILADSFFSAESYEELSAIAPTVLVDITAGDTDWEAQLREFGAWLDRSAEAEVAIADYDERVAEVGPDVQRAVGAGPVALIQGGSDGSMGVIGPDSNAGHLFADLGVDVWPLPESLLAGGPFRGQAGTATAGAEQFELLDAPSIVVLEGVPGETAQLEANPLWSTLPAVAADQVLVVSPGGPATRGGPLLKLLALDLLQAAAA